MSEIELHVYYVDWGYRNVLGAAQELAAARPEVELKTWNIAGAPADFLRERQITGFPTVRVSRDGKMLAESQQVTWSKTGLAQWLDDALRKAGESASASSIIRQHDDDHEQGVIGTAGYLPIRMEFYFGGWDSWEGQHLIFEDGALWYRNGHFLFEAADRRDFLRCVPDEQHWRQFWQEMDRIGVWDWQQEYENAHVLDGDLWDLKLEFGARRVAAKGSNAYPGWPHDPEFPADCTFAQFLAALRQLTGIKELFDELQSITRQPNRIPLNESTEPFVALLLEAVRNHQPVEFKYWGGREPGRLRCITPTLVFRYDDQGPIYVSGHCHLREQERTFLLEKMEQPNPPGI